VVYVVVKNSTMEKLQIALSEDAQWYYQVYAANGEHLVTSETYTQKHSAEEGFEALAVAVIRILVQHDQLGFALAKALKDGELLDKEIQD
jgi:uncharacterized protein YegP (UPF0339 family)